MYYNLINGKRQYTLKEGESAHPAKFSPEDVYSKYRIKIKQRFNISPFDNDK